MLTRVTATTKGGIEFWLGPLPASPGITHLETPYPTGVGHKTFALCTKVQAGPSCTNEETHEFSQALRIVVPGFHRNPDFDNNIIITPHKKKIKKKYTNSLLMTQCLCDTNEKASPGAIMPYFKQTNPLYTENCISLPRWICIHFLYMALWLYGSNPVHFYWTQGASKSSLNSFTQVCLSPVHRCARQCAKVHSLLQMKVTVTENTTKNKKAVSICP